MSTPLSTPLRQSKMAIATNKSLPLANEYKKLLNEQYQRLWTKHQQDLDLIDDIRSYVKARLSIERDYTSALNKLAKQHSNLITKKFVLLNQCDPNECRIDSPIPTGSSDEPMKIEARLKHESDISDSRLQKRLANNGLDEPDKPCTLYKVWSEHINRLNCTSKNRVDQFEQLIIVAERLKDIRSHKAYVGKKSLDAHLKRIHEDIVVSMAEVEKARKLYYEDEGQAKKARENEEKIRKRRSTLLSKFTDIQAKKEKTSAQREANDIQSTQARNDYIMALAAANAHLQHYYQRDLTEFINMIDDGVLDHCKIFMATLSECDLNSLKDALSHAQYWSKMINLTGSQKTNSIFLDCDQSACLRSKPNLIFEPCNEDPIRVISLEHNADYALQHEIDKWFTWFKKECRNLSHLMHQLEVCQKALSEGKKSVELNGQTTEDIESKIIEFKQNIRKSEAAKLKAQARLKAIKEGGMQIEEWSSVEAEIRADMARAQKELDAKRAKEIIHEDDSTDGDRMEIVNVDEQNKQVGTYMFDNQMDQVQLHISKNSDDSDDPDSVHNLASVSRSTSNIAQKQQNAISGYSALTDPSLVWQDDFSNAWANSPQQTNYNVVVTDTLSNKSPIELKQPEPDSGLLAANSNQGSNLAQHNQQSTSMTVQSSSPLSAILDGVQSASSPYHGIAGEAYKSDYECDYSRNGGHLMRSAASSAEPYNQYLQQSTTPQLDPFGRPINNSCELEGLNENPESELTSELDKTPDTGNDPAKFLNQRVIAIYSFDKTNEDDLSFNENDILNIIQINDANWLKARNESTGEVGYIPTSYVKLLADDDQQTKSISRDSDRIPSAQNPATVDSESEWFGQQNSELKVEPGDVYCRAVYNYKPKDDTYEEDGLPHLALMQGELMKIIDQGEDDGWWLVEKDISGTRGHVPSMLVEVMEPDDNMEEDEDYDADNVSQYSIDQCECSFNAVPEFEPPVLEKCDDTEIDVETIDQPDVNNNPESSTSTCDQNQNNPSSASLIPTSFIIIEPTPEVESKRVDDPTSSDRTEDDYKQRQPNDDRQIVHSINAKPPHDVSYSVINEEFVLEKPTRKPHQPSEKIQHHETPTIIEEVYDGDGQEELQDGNAANQGRPDGNYEPLSEVDSIDMPVPPAVVIEIFESEKQVRSDDSSEGEHEASQTESLNDHVQKEIKHTGNVDVNPMLRLRAEEFSKQIIAEAIMMAPGADIGPSTSDDTLD